MTNVWVGDGARKEKDGAREGGGEGGGGAGECQDRIGGIGRYVVVEDVGAVIVL